MTSWKDLLAEFDQPMKLMDDPAFPHATAEELARDPWADFDHPQILVPDDAPAPKARNKTAQGNALGKPSRNDKP
jgi:hypothetical protein